MNPTVNPLLREEPFFNEFRVSGLFDPVNGSTIAQNSEVRAEVLGSGIPALSYAVARNAVDVFHPPGGADRNIDMMTLQTGWPADRVLSLWENRWLHSDLREVAYPFNHKGVRDYY